MPSKRQDVRIGVRALGSLALCAAAAGAAFAHFAIDVVGDYVLPRDSYDYLDHGSRELMTGLALLLASALAVRGLRVCCEIGVANRTRLARPALALGHTLGFMIFAITTSVVAVPGMEYVDGLLDGARVDSLGDAFGGSIPLGLATTLLCSALVASLVYLLARWLISHRDTIATIIETIMRRTDVALRPSAYELIAQLLWPRRRRAAHALRLSKRGPPAFRFA
jgi:hypothetical protein